MNWQPEPYWQFWQRLVDPPLPPEPEPPTGWQVQKQLNRLAKRVAQIESGKWLPRTSFRLTGAHVRELKEAYALLGEARQAIKGG